MRSIEIHNASVRKRQKSQQRKTISSSSKYLFCASILSCQRRKQKHELQNRFGPFQEGNPEKPSTAQLMTGLPCREVLLSKQQQTSEQWFCILLFKSLNSFRVEKIVKKIKYRNQETISFYIWCLVAYFCKALA